MTTTSTFQGMEANSKPSSRVLAPPGGGSSNIFGGGDDSPGNARGTAKNINKGDNDIFGSGKQVAPGTSPGKRHNPDNVNCGNNDIFHREQHAAAAQPRSRAPRSGDNSFHTLFGGSYNSECERERGHDSASREGYKQAQIVERQTPHSNTSTPTCTSSNTFKTSTYGRTQPKQSDSFSNVFGGVETPGSKKTNDSNYSFSNMLLQGGSPSASELKSPSRGADRKSFNQSPMVAGSHISTKSIGHGDDESYNALPTSLNDLSLGGGDSYPDDDHDIDSSFSRVLGQYQANTTPRVNRFSNRGEYNPITGQPYEQPARKEEPAQEEEKEEEGSAEAAPAQEQQQQGEGNGLFRGPDQPAKPHASTRVSQPPGGRSTRLW